MLCATCGTRYELKEIGIALVKIQPAIGDKPERAVEVSSGDLWRCKCDNGIVRDIGESYARGNSAQQCMDNLQAHGVTIVKQMVPW